MRLAVLAVKKGHMRESLAAAFAAPDLRRLTSVPCPLPAIPIRPSPCSRYLSLAHKTWVRPVDG
jgi:hypothetical protein